jgi:hypothetical protein
MPDKRGALELSCNERAFRDPICRQVSVNAPSAYVGDKDNRRRLLPQNLTYPGGGYIVWPKDVAYPSVTPLYPRRRRQMKPRFVFPCLLLAMLVPYIVPAGRVNAARRLPATTTAITQPVLHLLPTDSDSDRRFELKSTTFEDHQFIPASTVCNGQLGSVCTGGNESPELSWTPGARGICSDHVVRCYGKLRALGEV